jgi:hypothetical protein
MKFPYQGYPVRGIGTTYQTLVYRPTVPIRILGPGGEALAYGLLDTGADDTLLPDYLLGPLGLVVEAGARATIAGVGGGIVTANFATVDLELRKGKSVYRWAATVGFYNGPNAILGQFGVLEHFLASFNHRQRYATLQPNGVLPAPNRSTP